MTGLTAQFSILDKMSDTIASISRAGLDMTDQFEKAGEASSAAFDSISGVATTTVTAADGAAASLESLNQAASGASDSAGELLNSMDSYGSAAEGAAAQTDYWTEAVGNYDRGALEAVYSTEELVEMGFKSAQALEEQERMLELCDQSATSLSAAMEASASAQDGLNSAIDSANEAMSELADNEGISADTKAELERASEAAAEAVRNLNAASEEATAAMENYDAVMSSGTTDLEELESAAERAGHAAEALAEANGKASEATDGLAKATQQATEEAEESGKKGTSSIEDIASTLAAAGITAMVKDISDSVYDLATAFSEAESTVVLATGATGEALDGLTTSMMNAYAASRTGSLDETAAAVGEINTRLGYTGTQLEETTGLFLDFAAVTGGNAAGSVRSVTQLMNQWKVPADNMESVLSKLTYAGQASGISVDALSQQLTTNKAILDQLGYSLDEATAMFMNFELSGTNASAVMTGFRTALSKGDISSLDELNDVLGQIESGAMDAAEASDIFGRRAGPAIVNAAESGVFSLDTFSEGLENASGTLETTADAAQTLDQKWEQATGNISAAFTGALEPAVGGVSSKLADLTNDMGDFLNEHPTVTRAISATGIALGTVITGIVGVATATTLATTVVIPALVKIGTAAWAALGPFGMIAIAVAGVTAGIAAYAAMSDDAVDETDNLTVSSQNMARELDSMNAEYEETCRQFGDNSAEAVLLKDEIDDLSQTYEESKMTVEEFYESLSAQLDAHNEIVDSYTEQKDAMRDQGEQTNNLVAKLRELSEQTDVTTASQEQMESIVGKLQEMYPGLGISIDGVNGNLDKMVNKINAVTNATNAQTEYENAQKTYSALVSEQEDLIRARDEAQDIYNRACEQYLDANIMQESVWALTGGGAAGAMDEAKAKLDAANEAIDENIRLQEECTDSMQEYADMANGTSDEVVTAEDAVSVAIGKTQDRITALAEEYSKAYQSALDSIEGQYSLWDKVSNKVLNAKTSVTDFQEALKSQAEYWDNYSENLDKLQNRDVKGLDDVLASMNDGSEESAAALAGMAEASDAELAKIVRNFKKLQTAQDEAATNIAGISTNYDDELTKIQDSMDKTVENMAKEDEAATAAEKTIQSYINKIRNMQGSVSAAASYVANAAARALTKNAPEPTTESDTTATATPAPAHANGTTNAERLFIAGEAGPELIVSKAAAYANGTTDSDDYYIAGEKGPELIIGQQGSTVFPAGETERIINAIGERQPVNVFGPSSGGGDRSSASEKHILLEIAGSGAIDIKGSGMDKEGILEIVQNHLKPILMNIIQQEVYEEGDLSYEY